MIDLGRDLCTDPAVSSRREWLVTNGIGGFASGTVSGIPTRRYHGLLVAALDPPLGRRLLVSSVHETVTYREDTFDLGATRWADGTVAPGGFVHLDRFRLDGTLPVWTYACGDALLEKRVWMEQGANTTYVRYTLDRASAPVELAVRTLVNHRDFHGTTRAGGWEMEVTREDDGGLRIRAFEDAVPLCLRSDRGAFEPAHVWYRDFHLEAEAERGLDAREDHLHAGTWRAGLEPGDACTLVCSAGTFAPADACALSREQERHRRLLEAADTSPASGVPGQLVLAAAQFVVRRSGASGGEGRSVIAGYPWFGDWGRDTMIALPGLTLATGRPGIAREILRTYGRHVDRGMIPNRFPETGGTPEYNTADATLWYVEAVRAYHAATGDDALVRDLLPVLEEIVENHQRGTRHRIHVDPGDGLLHAGETGVQLTWMDAKVGERAVTPRTGKPVEVSALWYNALRSVAGLHRVSGRPAERFDAAADRTEEGFGRFWDGERGHLRDVLDGPEGDDPALRPNQLLAVSLRYSPLDGARQRAVVDACTERLLTPHGLRSLAPGHPAYRGSYRGDVDWRDGAYHQGTVWSWLIGPYVKAHLRVYGDPELARTYLAPLLRQLSAHGLGQVSEIFDGDAPFHPRGCPAQAWAVGQLLEALTLPGASRGRR